MTKSSSQSESPRKRRSRVPRQAAQSEHPVSGTTPPPDRDAQPSTGPETGRSAAVSGDHRWVGLDVHKHQLTYCILDAGGTVVRQGQAEVYRPKVTEFARKILQPTDHVALETTTNCWAVVELLQPHVAQVVVSNPMATKAIATSKIKTDKVDAQVLAQLLRCDYLPTVWQPDSETRRRRQLCGRRASLVGQRTQLQNRIHSVLAMRLIIPPEKTTLFSAAGIAWLEGLTEPKVDADGLRMILSDLRLLKSVQAEIDAFEAQQVELAWQDNRVKLLMTIPGVSVAVAQALVAAFGDIRRFRTPDAAASYLGLVPSTRRSNNTVHHGPITKQGNSTARTMLVQAAQHYARQAGPLGHFFNRLKRRKNHNVAVVATARKLAMIAWRMLTTGEPYRYAAPRNTTDKLAKLRVAATGEKRRGGNRKGVQAEARLAGGSRTVRSLDDVYRNEGLPPRSPLAPGELRVLKDTGTQAFAERIASEHVIPRNTAKAAAHHAKITGRQTRKSAVSK